MRKVLIAVGIVVGVIVVASQARAQENSMFIYGTVTTIKGDTYTGTMRWGSDEVYWVELFNGEKTSNDFLKFLSRKEIETLQGEAEGNSWLGIDWDVMSIWEDKFSNTSHRFDTRFGDIKSIEPTGKDEARLTLKNGVILELDGGSSEDVGTTIRVYDYELGEIKVPWSRIEKIEFEQASEAPSYTFGKPIYGRVDAGRKGVFQGIVQWDKDERFQEEMLSGDDRSGRRDIPFSSIQRIRKNRNGSEVTLKSGREFFLTGTNDVNNDNRGIVVNDPNVGQIVIPWRDFVEIELISEEVEGFRYNDFEVSQGLTATVVTIDGDDYSGLMAFDLDEAWEFEILDGKDDNVQYDIPMRNIKNIIPKNYNYSTIILRDGTELLLGDERDVSDKNSGVLIFTSRDDDPVYVKWSRIDEIIFD